MKIKFDGTNDNGDEISATIRILSVDDVNNQLTTYAKAGTTNYTSASVLDEQEQPVMILFKNDDGLWSIDY